MARALNTSHPLYPYLTSLIGVEDDGVTVKDFVDATRTCTLAAESSIATGSLGYHVVTGHNGGSRARGVLLSKIVTFGTPANPDATIVIVHAENSRCHITQWGSPGGLSTNVRRVYLGVNTAIQAFDSCVPQLCVTDPASTSELALNDVTGTRQITGTTAIGAAYVSVAATRTGTTSSEIFRNGVSEGTGGSLGALSTARGFSHIGGYYNWDYGYAQSSIVWVATFNKVLTPTEQADLHASLGADNAFALVTTGTGNTITVNEFDRYEVIPTGPSGASVTFTGTYSGADPASVQIRILEFGTVTEVSTWQTLDAAPAAGAFSGTITVPRGGWYEAEVRYSDDTPTAASTSLEFGVGVVAFGLGQSHIQAFLEEGASPAASSDRIVTHNGTAYTLVPSAGSGQHQMLNDLETALDCPICWIPKGVGGTLLSYWYSSGSGPTAAMSTELAKLTAAGGSAHIFVWWQGDANAQGATPKATYRAELDSLAAYMRANYGVDAVIVCALGRYGVGADSVWNNIREAHVGFCEASADNYIVVTTDLAQEVDQQHFTEAGEIVAGQRLADVIAEAMGTGSGSQGPRVSGAVQSGADTVDVTIAHDGGTDISPVTGITGFSAYLSGTPLTISSVVRLTASSVRITLAAPSSVDSIRYQYGAYPDVSGQLVDDTSLALPLRSTSNAVLTGSIVADGAFADIAISAFAGDAVGETVIPATGDGALADITLSALTGDAVGETVIPATGDGPLVDITIFALLGDASGETIIPATGDGPLTGIILSAFAGDAVGETVIPATGEGTLTGITISALSGGALGETGTTAIGLGVTAQWSMLEAITCSSAINWDLLSLASAGHNITLRWDSVTSSGVNFICRWQIGDTTGKTYSYVDVLVVPAEKRVMVVGVDDILTAVLR